MKRKLDTPDVESEKKRRKVEDLSSVPFRPFVESPRKTPKNPTGFSSFRIQNELLQGDEKSNDPPKISPETKRSKTQNKREKKEIDELEALFLGIVDESDDDGGNETKKIEEHLPVKKKIEKIVVEEQKEDEEVHEVEKTRPLPPPPNNLVEEDDDYEEDSPILDDPHQYYKRESPTEIQTQTCFSRTRNKRVEELEAVNGKQQNEISQLKEHNRVLIDFLEEVDREQDKLNEMIRKKRIEGDAFFLPMRQQGAQKQGPRVYHASQNMFQPRQREFARGGGGGNVGNRNGNFGRREMGMNGFDRQFRSHGVGNQQLQAQNLNRSGNGRF